MTGTEQQTHILVTGARGVGKSTLIRRLLLENARPVRGFITERLPADQTGFHPIYVHAADEKPRTYTERNCIGRCDAKTHAVNLDAFNTLGAAYLSAKPGEIIVMDELGFMEAEAKLFTNQVFSVLDGSIPVIAAVKARPDVPFLSAVCAHPNCRVYTVTEESRDALFVELIPIIRKWNRV